MKTPTLQHAKHNPLKNQKGWIAVLGLAVILTATQNVQATVTESIPVSVLASNVQTVINGSSTNTTATYFQFGTNKLSVVDNYFSINSGAYLLNPYNIVNTNQLVAGNSKAVFYLQLSFDYVAAWNVQRRQRIVSDYLDNHNYAIGDWGGFENQWFSLNKEKSLNPLKRLEFKRPFRTLDLSGNISYFLQGNSQPTASTIVGAGEFSAEGTLGIPIFIGVFTDEKTLGTNDLGGENLTNLYSHTTSVHWVGLVESYGVTTDRGDLNAHSRVFSGLGYRAAYKSPFGNLREVLVSVQMGCAWIDSTHFLNSASNTIQTQNGVPLYSMEPGFAIESDFRVPISDSADLDFGTSVYCNHQPDTWNAHIGLTFPLDKLTSFMK